MRQFLSITGRISRRILQSIHTVPRRSLLAWLVLVVFFGGQAANLPPDPGQRIPLQAGSRPAAITPDPVIQAILNQVKSDTLSSYVSGLSGEAPVNIGGSAYTLATRSTGAAASIEKATQYAFEHFSALGLPTVYHTWWYSGGERRNVVATQAGSDPACFYLVTAHLDSTSGSPNTLAPGADDNASGTAGVFVVADILSKYQFECTIQYVLFTGEEQGLLGSDAYAWDAADRGDPIRGVLNLDMIAFNTPGSAATIEMDIRSGPAGNPDRVLTDRISDVIQAYQLGLTSLVYASDDDGSDQYSFWMAGFPAVEVIEDWDDHSPYYHKTTDRVGTLNMPYYTAYVKAVVGALAHLGRIVTVVDRPYHVYLSIIKR